MSEESKKASVLISEGKGRILLQNPFFGVLLSMTNFREDVTIPTMATDGINIYYNSKYTCGLDKKEVLGVLLHEIMHCIYMHCSPKRRLSRDREKWNVAIDHAVNLEIKTIAWCALPDHALMDGKFSDMCAEEIYDAILNQDTSKCKTLDMHLEASDSTDWDEMEDRIISVYEITKNSKMFGNTPSGIARWIDKLRKAKVRWEKLFHRLVGAALNRDDYSYARLNRRHLPQDIYLPALHNKIVGHVVVAFDTSGSITDEIAKQFVSELAKISHLVKEVTVMTCDAAVHEVVKIRQMSEILKKIEFKGGGGTDFRPIFDKIAEKRITPELAIYLTDAFGTFPEKPPGYPVVWCVTNEDGIKGIPWGKIILIPDMSKY